MIWPFWLEVHCLSFYAYVMLTNTKMHAGWVPPCICIFGLLVPQSFIAFNLKLKIIKIDFAIENLAIFCQYQFLVCWSSYNGKLYYRKALVYCFLEGSTWAVDKMMPLLNNAVRKRYIS